MIRCIPRILGLLWNTCYFAGLKTKRGETADPICKSRNMEQVTNSDSQINNTENSMPWHSNENYIYVVNTVNNHEVCKSKCNRQGLQ